MGVEGVRHRRHHNARDEDDHTERDGAAIAGHLSTASGCGQLDFIDVRDVHCHDDTGVLLGFVPVQLLSRDRCRHPRGTPGDSGSAFVVAVVQHGYFTGKEEVGHLDSDVSDQPITEQLAKNTTQDSIINKTMLF